tara:strand:+ start:249 stop:545 length:297 start_codon:yes stop_codon:yes gene_type:complete
MSCEQKNLFDDFPSIDILTKIYSNNNLLFYQIDESGTIHGASPALRNYGYEKNDVIGTKLSTYMNELEAEHFHKTKTGDMIQIEKTTIDKQILMIKVI